MLASFSILIQSRPAQLNANEVQSRPNIILIVADDIGEQLDLADRHPDVVRRMVNVMRSARVPSKLFVMKPLDELP